MYVRSLFHEKADFWGAEFRHWAEFNKAEFRAAAIFTNCRFAGATHFFRTVFQCAVEFRAIQVEGIFSLAESEFSHVPVFYEAHFLETLLFDEVDLDFARLRKNAADTHEVSIPVRWRALRKLAQQAHDDERVLKFFKAEIVSRRNKEDRPYHLRFWIGCLYQVTSDFGLSISRPLIWLACIFVLCSFLYMFPIGTVSGIPADLFSMECITGTGHRWASALSLSLHHTAPFTLLGISDLLKQNYMCLYGGNTIEFASLEHPTTEWDDTTVPIYMQVVGAFQFLLSSVLVFLMFLAVRNLFRIR